MSRMDPLQGIDIGSLDWEEMYRLLVRRGMSPQAAIEQIDTIERALLTLQRKRDLGSTARLLEADPKLFASLGLIQLH